MTKRSFLTTRRALIQGAAGIVAAAALFGARPAFALSTADVEDLDRVSAYLNGIKAATGSFTQFGQDGSMAEGRFFLHRPGRVRFEYTEPKEMPIIVSDGRWVAVEDRRLRTTSRYPLNSTPLSILLKDPIDLAKETRIVEVARQPGVLSVTARDSDGIAQGELTLIFRDPGLELRNWIVKDAQGWYTTVAIREMKQGVAIAPQLFVVKEPPKVGRPKN